MSLSLLDRAEVVAKMILDCAVLPTRAKAERYSGDTSWHTDSVIPISSVGFAAYLEPQLWCMRTESLDRYPVLVSRRILNLLEQTMARCVCCRAHIARSFRKPFARSAPASLPGHCPPT